MAADREGSADLVCSKQYAFIVASNGTLLIGLSDATERVELSVEDRLSATRLGVAQAAPGTDATTSLNLERGDYVARIRGSTAQGAHFRLSLRQTPFGEIEPDPEPGGDQATALRVGRLSEFKTIGGYVGVTDPEDFYMFELAANGSVTFGAGEVVGEVVVQLFPDAPLINVNQPYLSRNAATNTDDVRADILEKGIYYVRIIPSRQISSLYKLRMSAAPYATPEGPQDPPQDWSQAQMLGTLSGARLDVGGYVGGTDPQDFYRFELLSNTTLTYTVGNVQGGVAAYLYESATQIDLTRWIDESRQVTSQWTKAIQRNAGSYYLRVVPLGNVNSLYTLSLSVAGQ